MPPVQILKRSDPFSQELQRLRGKLRDQGFFSSPDMTGPFDAATEDAVIYFQQTHLGPDKKPLSVNGIIDESTRWALHNPTGAAQKSFLEPSIPKGIVAQREAVLAVALGQHALGVKERPNGSNRSKEIDKYFPQWQLNKLAPGEKGPAWCAFFVNWVVTQAMTGRPWGGYIGSCSKLAEQCGKLPGILVYSPADVLMGNIPMRPGDLFFTLHPKKPGKAQTGHVGFVLRVNRTQKKFNSIEGNCGNRVKCGERETESISCFVNFYGGGPENQPERFVRSLVVATNVANEDTR